VVLLRDLLHQVADGSLGEIDSAVVVVTLLGAAESNVEACDRLGRPLHWGSVCRVDIDGLDVSGSGVI
jgi:hypothetical protein